MKKAIIVCLLFVFLFSFLTITIAQPTENVTLPIKVTPPPPLPQPPPLPPRSPLTLRGGLKAGYYRFFPLDTQLSGFYKGQIMFGASFGAMASNGLELQVDVDYSKATNSQFSTIDLEIIPILVTMRYHPLKRSPISPYIGGGLGIYYIKEASDNFNYLRTIKFGTSIVAGVDINFHESTSFRIEGRRDYVGNVNNSLYYKANFGGFRATAGLIFELPIRKRRRYRRNPQPYKSYYEKRLEVLDERIATLEAEIERLETKKKYYWGWSDDYETEDDLKWEIRRLRYRLKRYKGTLGKVKTQKEKAEHDAYIEMRKKIKGETIKKSPPSDTSGYKTKKAKKKEEKKEEEEKKKTKEEEEKDKYIKERLKRRKEAKSKAK